MSDFRHQIEEDIAEYQNLHKHIPNISKPEWAFNYWVLDKMFLKMKNLLKRKSLIITILVLMRMKYMKIPKIFTLSRINIIVIRQPSLLNM